jgi:hypothetical protein
MLMNFIARWLAGYFRDQAKGEPAWPQVLQLICNKRTLRKIGREYLRQAPHENSVELLEQMILCNQVETPEETLAPNVKKDFDASRVVVINGWILAITEARQCALLYLS